MLRRRESGVRRRRITVPSEIPKYYDTSNISKYYYTSDISKYYYTSTVKVYILCHNQARYDEVLPIYSPYPWAVPIVMKYQDASFENAFWKQMLELYDDWKECEMVGAFSSKTYAKLGLQKIDNIIRNTDLKCVKYYHFEDQRIPIVFKCHPNLKPICEDIAKKFAFDLSVATENNCNTWMCKPHLMLKFARWFEEEMRPYIFSHPLAMTNAKYNCGSLTAETCMKLAGVPYYPHIPFVLERMNKCFFDKAIREQLHILCVGHEFSLTGAPIALFNLGKYIDANTDYTVRICSAAEFNTGMLDIPGLKAVILNTLVCYNVIKQIQKPGVKVLWWIHEWPDATMIHYFPWLMTDKLVYNRASTLLFPCEKALMNFLTVAPWTPANKCKILTYGYRGVPQQTQVATTSTDKIILTIVGTIEYRKNQDAFVNHVFVPLLNRYPNLELRLFGQIREQLNIPQDVKEKVVLVGVVKDANPYIAETDIHVSYSINEVLPLNILEAMRLGKPVVSTDVGGCSDLVVDGETGFLVASNAHADAISKLSTLIENAELRKSFGASAKERFLSRYEESIAFNPIRTYLSE